MAAGPRSKNLEEQQMFVYTLVCGCIIETNPPANVQRIGFCISHQRDIDPNRDGSLNEGRTAVLWGKMEQKVAGYQQIIAASNDPMKNR